VIETLLSEGYNVQLKHMSDESQATLGNVSLKTTDGVTLSTFPGFQGNRFVRDMPRNAAKLVAEALCKLEEAIPTLPAPTGGAPSECAGQSMCCPDKSAAEKAECCGKKLGEEAAAEMMPARMKAAAGRKAAEGSGGCTTKGGCAEGECGFSMVQLVLVGLVLVLAAGRPLPLLLEHAGQRGHRRARRQGAARGCGRGRCQDGARGSAGGGSGGGGPRVRPLPTRVRPLPTRVRPLPTRVRPLPTRVRPLPTRVRPLPTRVRPLPTRGSDRDIASVVQGGWRTV